MRWLGGAWPRADWQPTRAIEVTHATQRRRSEKISSLGDGHASYDRHHKLSCCGQKTEKQSSCTARLQDLSKKRRTAPQSARFIGRDLRAPNNGPGHPRRGAV